MTNINVAPTDFETIRLIWTDINGVARGILINTDDNTNNFDEKYGFANGITELTLQPGLLEAPAFGPEKGDMMAFGDGDSLIPVPWREETGIIFADLKTVDEKTFPLCTRSALKSVVEDFHEFNLEPKVGVEPEFSVMELDNNDSYVAINRRCSYDIDALDQHADMIDAWKQSMEIAGFEVSGIHQESQPGQFEINIEYSDALRTADTIMYLRHMIKSVTRQFEYEATFMPRPYTDEDANGMHMHLSVWNESGNIFASKDPNDQLQFPAGKEPKDGGISDKARYFMGGLLTHMKSLTAICAPTVNSYKRLVPGIWAPINITWGLDNRSTVLRVPPELGPHTRIEHRVPDTSANPYLAIASSLAAGLDGIRNEIDPGEYTIENAYDHDFDRLPRTLPSALTHLEQNATLQEALGEKLISSFIRLKREEFDRYQNHISEWEKEEYLYEF